MLIVVSVIGQTIRLQLIQKQGIILKKLVIKWMFTRKQGQE